MVPYRMIGVLYYFSLFAFNTSTVCVFSLKKKCYYAHSNCYLNRRHWRLKNYVENVFSCTLMYLQLYYGTDYVLVTQPIKTHIHICNFLNNDVLSFH